LDLLKGNKLFANATFLALLTFFLSSLIALLVKLGAGEIPRVQIAFVRFLVGFLILFSLLSTAQRKVAFEARWNPSLFLRAALGSLAFFGYIIAIPEMPLSLWTGIQFTNPILFTIFAFLLLGEKIPPLRWLAIALGFIGVVIAAEPTSGGASLVAVGILVAGCICAALSDIVVKRLVSRFESRIIVFFFAMYGTLFFMPFAMAQWVWPSVTGWLVLLSIGLCGVLSQLCLTSALNLAPASALAPFSYTALAWSIAFDFLFWHRLPNTHEFVGVLFILADGILAVRSRK
jgi:S-adenosylmethionine uptake transporter